MPDKRTLRIVVASPADVNAERNVLPIVIDELNRGIAAERGIHVELYRWETDAYPGFHPEGPQGLIDPALNIENCDVLIGIFWKRFGTPTTDAQSGTEHEVMTAYEKWKQSGHPQIMIYFNQQPYSPQSRAELDQWRQVLDFREHFPREGLWWPYQGRREFEKLVRNHLTQIIRREFAQVDKGAKAHRGPDELIEAYLARMSERLKEIYVFGEGQPRQLAEIFVMPDIIEEYERPSTQVEYVRSVEAEMQRRRGLGRDTEHMRELEEGGGRIGSGRIIDPYMRTILKGAPGCGKSMLLRYLAWKVLIGKERLPVFLEGRTLDAHALEQAQNDLARLLFEQAASLLSLDPIERDLFEKRFFDYLANLKVVIFLDGLDEASGSGFFPKLSSAITAFLHSDLAANTIVISTRPHALKARIAGFHEMTVAPLNDRQTDKLIKRYHGDSLTTKWLLLSLRQNRQLRELARVPFLLIVIARLRQSPDQGVHSRLEIYRQIVWQLAVQLDREKAIDRQDFYVPDPGGALKLDFLKWLACDRLLINTLTSDGTVQETSYLTFTGEVLLDKAKRFLDEAKRPEVSPYLLSADVKAMPLLREVGPDVYAFAHLTIQEYLAAEALWKRDDCEQIFCRSFFNPMLAEMEVLPMTLGLTSFPDALYAAVEQLPESLTFANLRVRARGLAYAPKISQQRLAGLVDRLIEFITDPSVEGMPYKEVVIRSFAAVDGKGLEMIVRHLAGLLDINDGDVRWDAAALLGQLGGAEAAEALIKALKSSHEDVAWAAAAALERIGGEQAAAALMRAVKDREGLVRERAIEALGEVGAPDAINLLIEALGEDEDGVRECAVEALGKIRDERAIGPLVEALADQRLSWLAKIALTTIGGEKTIRSLTEALTSEDRDMRWSAATLIADIGGESAVKALMGALKLEHRDVRRAAIRALGDLHEGTAVESLVQALYDEDWEVVAHAAGALAQIGTPAAVEALLETMKLEDTPPRKSAIDALATVNDARVLDALLGALPDPDWSVRASAVRALGRIGGEGVVAPLIHALEDAEEFVRQLAAEALLATGDERAVAALMIALKDSASSVRAAAARALGKFKATQAVELLTKLLSDKADYPRECAINALKEIGSDRAIDALINGLRSSYIEVRWKSAGALGEIGGKQAEDALITALGLEDGVVRDHAVGALGKIGGPPALEALIPILTDEGYFVRPRAAEALGNIADRKAVGPLAKALRADHSALRLSATEALGKIGGDEAVAALAEVFKEQDDVDFRARLSVPGALGRIGGPMVVAPLIKGLEDRHPYVGRRSAAVLGQIGEAELFKGLLRALSDDEPFVRRVAATVIGYYSPSGLGLEELQRLAKTEPESEVRQSAIEAQRRFERKLQYFN